MTGMGVGLSAPEDSLSVVPSALGPWTAQGSSVQLCRALKEISSSAEAKVCLPATFTCLYPKRSTHLQQQGFLSKPPLMTKREQGEKCKKIFKENLKKSYNFFLKTCKIRVKSLRIGKLTIEKIEIGSVFD